MFHPAFHDLLKPQWLAALTELKMGGSMSISALAQRLDSNYMTVKQHCETLTKLGYLNRRRKLLGEMGRPEVFYQLSEKSHGMFADIPTSFTLGMLELIQKTFGENAPERLLFQYFSEKEEEWKSRISKGSTLLYRAQLFAKIRGQEGLLIRCFNELEKGQITLRVHHHPLEPIFLKFPRSIGLELRSIEAAFGLKISRIAHTEPGSEVLYVDFILSSAAQV